MGLRPISATLQGLSVPWKNSESYPATAAASSTNRCAVAISPASTAAKYSVSKRLSCAKRTCSSPARSGDIRSWVTRKNSRSSAIPSATSRASLRIMLRVLIWKVVSEPSMLVKLSSSSIVSMRGSPLLMPKNSSIDSTKRVNRDLCFGGVASLTSAWNLVSVRA